MPASDQGITLDRYMLVPRTLIFLTRGDSVLLLKGAENKRLWAGLYNGVGGHIERGEDILSAAQRELQEETGFLSSNLWLCGIVTIDTQTNPGVGIFIFKGEYLEDMPLFSNEGVLDWTEIKEIGKLPLVSDLPSLLPKILVHKSNQPPFIASSKYDEFGKLVVNFKK